MAHLVGSPSQKALRAAYSSVSPCGKPIPEGAACSLLERLTLWEAHPRRRCVQPTRAAHLVGSPSQKALRAAYSSGSPSGKPITLKMRSSWSWWYGLLVFRSSCRQWKIGSEVSSSAKIQPIAQMSAVRKREASRQHTRWHHRSSAFLYRNHYHGSSTL